jgi:hypothetical protein
VSVYVDDDAVPSRFGHATISYRFGDTGQPAFCLPELHGRMVEFRPMEHPQD